MQDQLSVERFDIVVVGGGLCGLTAAISLKSLGLSVAVVEKRPIDVAQKSSAKKAVRTVAVARYSKEFLENLGAWSKVSNMAGSIVDIKVNNNPASYSFLLKSEEALVGEMGYVVCANTLRSTLQSKASEVGCVFVQDGCKKVDGPRLMLESGKVILAGSIVIAEGKMQHICKNLGFEYINMNYNQAALTFSIKCDRGHNNLAIESFMKDGMLALLPLKDKKMFNVVWTLTTSQAESLYQLKNADLIARLVEDRLKSFWKCCLTLESEVSFNPLSFSLVKRNIKNNVILIGDAAHAMHPVAGQGYNLAIRDIEQMKEGIARNIGLGLLPFDEGFANFSNQRRLDVLSMMSFTHFIVSIFKAQNSTINYIKDIGMKAFNGVDFIKHKTIKRAMGYT